MPSIIQWGCEQRRTGAPWPGGPGAGSGGQTAKLCSASHDTKGKKSRPSWTFSLEYAVETSEECGRRSQMGQLEYGRCVNPLLVASPATSKHERD